jgi:CRISPR-associated endoribonuclease Cas6
MKYGNIKNIIISSPENNMILTLNKKIKEISSLNLGKSTFKVLNSKVFQLKLNSLNFTTMTPIIIRIPQMVYRYYDLKLSHPYKYIFWRKRFPLDLFIKQIELNLKRKYHSYYNKNNSANIFNSATLILQKQISHKISIAGKEQIIIGTLWDFWFDKFDDKRYKFFYEKDNNDIDLFKEDFEVLKFAIESGFGERNSLGYGFVNPL